MNKYYLTDKLYLLDNKLYYEDKNSSKLIKNHNWHTLLSDYGWNKLHLKWIKKFNHLSDIKNKNSLFGVLDCGGEGDCLFHCISQALKSNDYFNTIHDYEVSDLRKKICDKIDYDKFLEIINYYKIFKDSDDFYESWDPYSITYDEFKELLLEGGNNYWGDNIILNILKETLNINMIILTENNHQNTFDYYPILYDFDENLNTIILLYEDEIHFKLVGYFKDNNMITYFNKTTIPSEILKLIKFLR
tara:strand:+ start:168 stop:905 length:738 start_codon:yes stop_codon:yes gene_type:complete